MKRIWTTVLVSTFLLTGLRAEDSTQVFGGFSAEVLRGPNREASAYNGWNVSIARRVFWNVSLAADFGGHYGQENGVVDNRVHTFLFGPRLTLHNGRIAPFVQVLLGASRLTADAGGPVFAANAFTLGAGGGVDVRITRRWSVRVAQFDYLHRQFFGEPPSTGRISGGIVFHLSK